MDTTDYSLIKEQSRKFWIQNLIVNVTMRMDFFYGTIPDDLKIVKILRSNDKGNSRSCYVFNGIVLMVDLSCPEDIIYNPFTGAVKKVLDPESDRKCNYADGFFYGTIPDDLKIVKILRSNDKGNSRSCY
ncbi:hypothetical protein Tco_0323661, partial [Tanacetum coccineum]